MNDLGTRQMACHDYNEVFTLNDYRDMFFDLISLEKISETVLKELRYYSGNDSITDKESLIDYLIELFEDGEYLIQEDGQLTLDMTRLRT